MPSNLETIYNRGQKRSRSVTWYKQPTEGASCPPEDRSVTLAKSYWNSFGCTGSEPQSKVNAKIAKAKACASERMADLYHLLQEGARLDNSHAYPIKLAYGLGKQCMQVNNISILSEYDRDFDFWYNQLTGNRTRPAIDAIFAENNVSNTIHPLIGYNASRNHSVKRARALPKEYIINENNENNRINPVINPIQNRIIDQEWSIIPSYMRSKQTPNENVKINDNKMHNVSNTKSQSNLNNNNILSSSFARQKPKGKKGGRRQTVRKGSNKRHNQSREI